jgi:putative phage-type endonuclease
MARIEIQQGSVEWLVLRKSKIGGSDIASVLGVNPYKSRFALFKEKLSPVDQSLNDAMRHGRDTEEEARNFFNETFQEDFSPAVFICDEWEGAIASLDGISSNGKVIEELKCPTSEKSGVPIYYEVQCQWNLMCSKAEVCYFRYYWKDKTYKNYIIKANREMQEMMLKKAKTFSQELKEYCLTDNSLLRKADMYIELDQQIKALELEKKHYRTFLIKACKGKYAKIGDLFIDEREIATNRIDLKQLYEDYMIDKEKLKEYELSKRRSTHYFSY